MRKQKTDIDFMHSQNCIDTFQTLNISQMGSHSQQTRVVSVHTNFSTKLRGFSLNEIKAKYKINKYEFIFIENKIHI